MLLDKLTNSDSAAATPRKRINRHSSSFFHSSQEQKTVKAKMHKMNDLGQEESLAKNEPKDHQKEPEDDDEGDAASAQAEATAAEPKASATAGTAGDGGEEAAAAAEEEDGNEEGNGNDQSNDGSTDESDKGKTTTTPPQKKEELIRVSLTIESVGLSDLSSDQQAFLKRKAKDKICQVSKVQKNAVSIEVVHEDGSVKVKAVIKITDEEGSAESIKKSAESSKKALLSSDLSEEIEKVAEKFDGVKKKLAGKELKVGHLEVKIDEEESEDNDKKSKKSEPEPLTLDHRIFGFFSALHLSTMMLLMIAGPVLICCCVASWRVISWNSKIKASGRKPIRGTLTCCCGFCTPLACCFPCDAGDVVDDHHHQQYQQQQFEDYQQYQDYQQITTEQQQYAMQQQQMYQERQYGW